MRRLVLLGLSPVLVPAGVFVGGVKSVVVGLHDLRHGRPRFEKELNGLIVSCAALAAPPGAAAAAWFGYRSCGLSPGGARGTVNSMVLAGVAYICTLLLMALIGTGFSAQGSAEPPRRRAVYICRTAAGLAYVLGISLAMVLVPLALLLSI